MFPKRCGNYGKGRVLGNITRVEAMKPPEPPRVARVADQSIVSIVYRAKALELVWGLRESGSISVCAGTNGATGLRTHRRKSTSHVSQVDSSWAMRLIPLEGTATFNVANRRSGDWDLGDQRVMRNWNTCDWAHLQCSKGPPLTPDLAARKRSLPANNCTGNYRSLEEF